VYGIEGEIDWKLFEHLTLSAGWNWISAEFTTSFCGTNSDGSIIESCAPQSAKTPKGTELPVTPKFKGNLTARYEFVVKDFNSFFQASVLDQSSTSATADVSQNALFGTIGGFNTADFSAGFGKGNWKVQAYIENAFDRRGELTRFAQCAFAVCQSNYHAYPTTPENFGIKFGEKF
jgi:outer membrane receptor protein involved in Fe transport